MAKPTTNPEWATDATYDSDGEANKIAPGSTLRADGWERGERPGAEHVNYLLGAHGAHIDYLHAIVEADGSESIPSVTRSLVLSAAVMRPIRLSGTPAIPAYSAGGVWELSESTLALWMPLNRYVPFGAQLTGADLLMSASTKSAAGALRLRLLPVNFDTPAWGDGGGSAITIASATTSGTGAQVLTVGAWTLDDANEPLFLFYEPGTITSGIDQIAAVRLRFNDPGPRNF